MAVVEKEKVGKCQIQLEVNLTIAREKGEGGKRGVQVSEVRCHLTEWGAQFYLNVRLQVVWDIYLRRSSRQTEQGVWGPGETA